MKNITLNINNLLAEGKTEEEIVKMLKTSISDIKRQEAEEKARQIELRDAREDIVASVLEWFRLTDIIKIDEDNVNKYANMIRNSLEELEKSKVSRVRVSKPTDLFSMWF